MNVVAAGRLGPGASVRPIASRLASRIGCALLTIGILLAGLWSSGAIWYRWPAGELTRRLLGGTGLLLAVLTVACLATPKRWLALAVYLGFVLLVIGWWRTLTPTNDRNWAPDVARAVTADIDGDRLMVHNVRNFTWRSETDFDQRWEERAYHLSHVTDVDLIMSYWVGEAIAHTIISFGFEDAPRLAFSIETRKESHEGYSSIAGFFKQYELAIVAADERDVVRLRSNMRGEDVRIYRLRMTPANAQILLRQYAQEVNGLAREPRFYNTLTANCTKLVFDMVRVIHPGLPMDVRVLFSGYLPNYAYDLGATDNSIPFEKLRDLARIRDKAVQADADPRFSARIREGIPVPH
ncbi:MAG: DUF4105 domain-containing protein [Alphaproteobacteria bacterium]|nr:DUF4105 domain-containing protein [Alphaproteobacteria bacterium]